MMEAKWIIIAVILVGAIALIYYLIRRNQKDKEDVIKYLNETEMEDGATQNEKDED